MNLSATEVEGALFCVNEVISHRQYAGTPVPHWMLQLGSRFNLASLTSGMSPAGHEFDSEGGELDSAFLGSTETADLLSLSPRQVRRLRERLGGHMFGGRMVFKRQTVIEYAKEQNGKPRRSV